MAHSADSPWPSKRKSTRFRIEVRSEFTALRTEMRDEFAAVRTEMKDEFVTVMTRHGAICACCTKMSSNESRRCKNASMPVRRAHAAAAASKQNSFVIFVAFVIFVRIRRHSLAPR